MTFFEIVDVLNLNFQNIINIDLTLNLNIIEKKFIKILILIDNNIKYYKLFFVEIKKKLGKVKLKTIRNEIFFQKIDIFAFIFFNSQTGFKLKIYCSI